jgi:hypothetical protein
MYSTVKWGKEQRSSEAADSQTLRLKISCDHATNDSIAPTASHWRELEQRRAMAAAPSIRKLSVIGVVVRGEKEE